MKSSINENSENYKYSNKKAFKRFFRTYSKASAIAVPLTIVILSFQNCAPKYSKFDTAAASSGQLAGASMTPLSITGTSSDAGVNPLNIGAASTSNISPGVTTPFQVVDRSISNGTTMSRLIQTISGGGSGLRGCTNPISNITTGCMKDSDFGLIANAWGADSFNSATDTYSINLDVSKLGYPHTTYFSRFILANGARHEVTFTPTNTTTSTSTSTNTTSTTTSGLKWVLTSSAFCTGPVTPPVKIGSACTVKGQTVSYQCGTFTCQ